MALDNGIENEAANEEQRSETTECDSDDCCRKARDEAGKPKKFEAMRKDEVDELLKKFNVKLENDNGYDHVYVANMAKSDYMKSSIADEQHLALFVKDYIDDVDAYDGMPFTRFLADCVGKGVAISWEDVL